MTIKNQPLVSIIITTKNEEKNIENCLKSIRNQTYKNIEIIVVDNYSEDNTINIAKKYTSKVYFRGPERSSQRNYGAEVSKGKYLFFLDADMIMAPNVVEKCLTKNNTSRHNNTVKGIPSKRSGFKCFGKVPNVEMNWY